MPRGPVVMGALAKKISAARAQEDRGAFAPPASAHGQLLDVDEDRGGLGAVRGCQAFAQVGIGVEEADGFVLGREA